jgi:hypothetical protein
LLCVLCALSWPTSDQTRGIATKEHKSHRVCRRGRKRKGRRSPPLCLSAFVFTLCRSSSLCTGAGHLGATDASERRPYPQMSRISANGSRKETGSRSPGGPGAPRTGARNAGRGAATGKNEEKSPRKARNGNVPHSCLRWRTLSHNAQWTRRLPWGGTLLCRPGQFQRRGSGGVIPHSICPKSIAISDAITVMNVDTNHDSRHPAQGTDRGRGYGPAVSAAPYWMAGTARISGERREARPEARITC